MGLFKQTGSKTGRIASAQSGSLVGVQQVLELILEQQIIQTKLLERIAHPAVIVSGTATGRFTGRGVGNTSYTGAQRAITESPPPNS